MEKKIIRSELVLDTKLDDKNSVRVSKTQREGEGAMCIDIRRFRMYPINGHYDGNMKATPKGVAIPLEKLPQIICALYDIYEEEFGKPFDRNEDGINE